LAIHAKGGESISPKQKDRTTTLILKESISPKQKDRTTTLILKEFFKLVSYRVQKGEKVILSKLIS
jgi:hypothetical protein